MKKLIPPTTKRVEVNTCEEVNNEIRNDTICYINSFKNATGPVLSLMIDKLDHEWDTERVLETGAASAVFLSSAIGLKKSKSCLFCLTGVVGFFLLQHALQGWCPPLPIIRKMGIRTTEEINNEKIVLKHLRGDFNQNYKEANELLEMAEK